MREATYQDAIAVGQILNIHRDEVWKVVRGLQFKSESELWMAIHNAFRLPAAPRAAEAALDDDPEHPRPR
jgi:hypothetical protein